MTIQEVKEKHGISTLTFYRVYSLDKEKTKWLKATNEENTKIFIIHEHYFEQLKENQSRQDISIDSSRILDVNGNFLFDKYTLALTGSITLITLLDKEHVISIIPYIKNIFFNKIYDFEKEYKKLDEEHSGFIEPDVREKIAIEYEVVFRIEKSTWKIPYVIILEKIYTKENDKIKYSYRKCRARLQKFEKIEIASIQLYPYLIHTLLLLDRIRIDYIGEKEFDSRIFKNTFYFNNDINYRSNNECLYRISRTFYKLRETNNSNLVTLNNEQFSFKGSLWNNGNYIEGTYYLNIFPSSFYDSYREKFIDTNYCITNLYNYSPIDKSIEGNLISFNTDRASTQGENLFHGTYEECMKFLGDNKNIMNIKKSISRKNNKLYNEKLSNEAFEYYNGEGAESDYFDAITDGQIGSYDDFIENGGDIDNLENYI